MIGYRNEGEDWISPFHSVLHHCGRVSFLMFISGCSGKSSFWLPFISVQDNWQKDGGRQQSYLRVRPVAFQLKPLWEITSTCVSFKLGMNRSSLWEGPGAEQGGVGWLLNGQANRKDIMKAQQWSRTHLSCDSHVRCLPCFFIQSMQMLMSSPFTSLY